MSTIPGMDKMDTSSTALARIPTTRLFVKKAARVISAVRRVGLLRALGDLSLAEVLTLVTANIAQAFRGRRVTTQGSVTRYDGSSLRQPNSPYRATGHD